MAMEDVPPGFRRDFLEKIKKSKMYANRKPLADPHKWAEYWEETAALACDCLKEADAEIERLKGICNAK